MSSISLNCSIRSVNVVETCHQVDASYLLKNGDVFDVQAASQDQDELRAARKAARKAARQGAQQDAWGVDAATKPGKSKPDSSNSAKRPETRTPQLGPKALSSPQTKQSADC